MRKFPPQWPTRKAIEALTQRLRLSAEFCQDWEVEVADARRVGEFCDAYEGTTLSIEEKFALMALIIASYDDYLRDTPPTRRNQSLEDRIRRLLTENFPLHAHTVEYWCCLDEETWANPADPDDPDNGFLVTPLMRRVWRDVSNK